METKQTPETSFLIKITSGNGQSQKKEDYIEEFFFFTFSEVPRPICSRHIFFGVNDAGA
jgi:hypothetical protein